MRYVAGFLYALAIAKGDGQVPFEWGKAVCLFAAVVAFAFCIEHIVEKAIRRMFPG